GLANFGIADKPFGLYEMIPGVLANVVFMVGVTLMTKEPSAKVLDEFDKSIELSNKADRLTEKEFVEEADKHPLPLPAEIFLQPREPNVASRCLRQHGAAFLFLSGLSLGRS